MRTYSDKAWEIASLYSHYLASETRDLAAHIDLALDRAREELTSDVEQWKSSAQSLSSDNDVMRAENDHLWAVMNSLKARNERLENVMRHALDAVSKYPEHPMTASEVLIRQVLGGTGEKSEAEDDHS